MYLQFFNVAASGKVPLKDWIEGRKAIMKRLISGGLKHPFIVDNKQFALG